MKSLSARRAWIEISVTRYRPTPKPVALRKESVDRNPIVPTELTTLVKSLSARRAWIEMIASANFCRNRFVALRKESVDRNKMFACIGFH